MQLLPMWHKHCSCVLAYSHIPKIFMRLLPMWHKHVFTYWPVPGSWCQRTDQRSFANALCCRLWTRRSDRVPAIKRGQDQCKTYCVIAWKLPTVWYMTINCWGGGGGGGVVCIWGCEFFCLFFFCLEEKKSWTVEGVYIVCDLLSQQVVNVFIWTSVQVKSPLPPPTRRRLRPKYLRHFNWSCIDSFLHVCVFLSLSIYICCCFPRVPHSLYIYICMLLLSLSVSPLLYTMVLMLFIITGARQVWHHTSSVSHFWGTQGMREDIDKEGDYIKWHNVWYVQK